MAFYFASDLTNQTIYSIELYQTSVVTYAFYNFSNMLPR